MTYKDDFGVCGPETEGVGVGQRETVAHDATNCRLCMCKMPFILLVASALALRGLCGTIWASVCPTHKLSVERVESTPQKSFLQLVQLWKSQTQCS